MSVCSEELHEQIDEACPHDKPPEWFALRYEQARHDAVTKTPPPPEHYPPEPPPPESASAPSGWSPAPRGIKRPVPEPEPAPELPAPAASPDRPLPMCPSTPPPSIRVSYR